MTWLFRSTRVFRWTVGAGAGLALGCSTVGDGANAGTDGATESTGGTTTDGSATPGSTSSSGGTGSGGGASTTSTGSTGGASTGGASDTGTGTAGTGTTGTGSTGGSTGGGAPECVLDTDCELQNDCCGCDVWPNGKVPPCGAPPCFAPICDPLGITSDDLECRFGRCTFKDVTCDQDLVACDQDPPNCSPGDLPVVDGGCWSGGCVPAKACDVVPDCTYCQEGEACVQQVTQPGLKFSCQPIPVACGADGPDCDCAGAEYCPTPFDLCDDAGDAISCSCPRCNLPKRPSPK